LTKKDCRRISTHPATDRQNISFLKFFLLEYQNQQGKGFFQQFRTSGKLPVIHEPI